MKKFIFLFVLAASINFAQDVDFEGYGSTGIMFYDRNPLNDPNQVTYYRGKIQAEIEFEDWFEAQIDMRGSSFDNIMTLKEFSVKYEKIKYLGIEVGNIKRPFSYENLESSEDLYTVDESYLLDAISELGYGSRNINLMFYYEYDEDHPEVPYTYYFSLFKDNSAVSGAAFRGRYHLDDNYSFGFNYLYQYYSGDVPIKAHGTGIDFILDKKNYSFNSEIYLVQDPLQGRVRKLMDLETPVWTAGVRLFGRYTFFTDAEYVKAVEPLLMFTSYIPDIEAEKTHVLQLLAGVNIYLTEDFRARLNGDLLMTKNQYHTDDYSTKGSRIILEFQVRY